MQRRVAAAAAGPSAHLPITAPLPRGVAASAARAEFSKTQATSVGFFIMGFIGFFVKLTFIPINNIIVGMGDVGQAQTYGLLRGRL